MTSTYWSMTFIQPAVGDTDRCVMLYGQLGEIVGPMTVDLAEAWIDRFDNQSKTGDSLAASDNDVAGLPMRTRRKGPAAKTIAAPAHA